MESGQWSWGGLCSIQRTGPQNYLGGDMGKTLWGVGGEEKWSSA